jgi:peptidoglycan LD-endopeptidase CwlK
MVWKLSQSSKLNSSGINPKLAAIRDRALEISTIDFGHPKDAGLRTAVRQKQLFDEGASRCDGYNRRSKHQSGNAVDFYAYVDGASQWDIEYLAIVACAFLQAGSEMGYALRWGGHFRPLKRFHGKNYKAGWDGGHIELMDRF